MYAERGLWLKALKFSRLLRRGFAFPPNDMCIEVSTRCGLRCGKCYRLALSVPEKVMPMEVFDTVLGRLADAAGARGIGYLTFVGLGETFANPALPDMLARAKKRLGGVRVNLSTNLLDCPPGALSRVVRERLADRISFSVDGEDSDGGFYLAQTPRLREVLTELRGLRARHHPEMGLRLQSILISREQVNAVVGLAAEFGADPVTLTRLDLHSFGTRPPRRRPGAAEERALLAYARARAAQLGVSVWNHNEHNLFMRLASRFDRYCLLTDDHLFVDVEANVLPCYSRRGEVLGNLRRQPLAEIVAAKRRAGLYGSQPASCGGCDIYKERLLH